MISGGLEVGVRVRRIGVASILGIQCSQAKSNSEDKSFKAHLYILISFFMDCRFLAALPFLSASLFAQFAYDPRLSFRVEADGREMTLLSGTDAIVSSGDEFRFRLA